MTATTINNSLFVSFLLLGVESRLEPELPEVVQMQVPEVHAGCQGVRGEGDGAAVGDAELPRLGRHATGTK